MNNDQNQLFQPVQSPPVPENGVDNSTVETDPATLQNVVFFKVNQRMFAKGEITFPCLPGAIDRFIQQIEGLFTALQKPFSASEIANLRQVMLARMEQAFQSSPHSFVTFRYEPAQPPQPGFVCQVNVASTSVAQQYTNWVSSRQPPLFGKYPDAKVMAIVGQLGTPETNPVIDIGAGTGRNSVPIAQLGYPVDAVELTPAFAQQIREIATEKGLPITVTEGNILDPLVRLRPSHYQLAIVSEVISHLRGVDQLRLLFAKMCDFLRPGGVLLCNLFLTVDGYELPQVFREWGEVSFSSIYTRADLAAAMERLPLQLLLEEAVYDYEKANQPADGWPPTSWYDSWSNGRDVFPVQKHPPINLQWLLLRRI
jgi:SAM-dependent methyltransferase